MSTSENLELTDLISNWLSEHMPEWRVSVPKHSDDPLDPDEPWYPKESIGHIEYYDGIAYIAAYIYPTKVEFVYNYGSSSSLKTKDKSSMDRGLVLDAHCENFLPLLSNRLYMMGLGFKAAVESRERNKRLANNQGIPN
jgi:hypothetical protein